MSANLFVSSPITEGYYVATNMTSGLQIGYDWFAVRPMDDSIIIESKHTMFGSSGIPVQLARFYIYPDWTPQRLEVKAESVFSVDMEFGDHETILSTSSAEGSHQMRFPVGRQRAFVLLSGGLYFPLHIVRRFRFEDPMPQQFNIIPEGIAEVRRLDDVIDSGQSYQLLEVKLWVAGMEDLLRLFVNERGDLIRYQTRNQNLLVKLEERGLLC